MIPFIISAAPEQSVREMVGAILSAVLLLGGGLGLLILTILVAVVVTRRRRVTPSTETSTPLHEDPWWDAAERLDEDH